MTETAIHSAVPEDVSQQPRRRAWLAALLTLLAPGAGQVYAGQMRRGLALHLGGYVIIALFVIAYATGPEGAAVVILPILVVLGYVIFIAIDAWRAVRLVTNTTRRRRWLAAICLVIFSAVVGDAYRGWLRSQVGEAFRIASISMEPTLYAGDYVYVKRQDPATLERDQLAAWRDTGSIWLHRVVDLPGDTLQMNGTRLLRNGTLLVEPYVQYSSGVSDTLGHRHWGPLVVPADSVFVLGDHRDNSYDSRYFGPISRPQIFALPTRVFFSRDPNANRIRWDRLGRRVDRRETDPTA